MLVSGVWRLWLTPRRKSSLAASSSSSWAFWASTVANSWALRIATATSLGEQLEQVLVGALPGPGRRQVADEHAQPLVADPQVGPDRTRLAGDELLGRDGRRIDQDDLGVDHPERRPGIRGRAPTRNSTPSRGDARSIAARIRPSSRLRRSRSAAEPVVAVGQAGQLVVAGDPIGVDRSPAVTRSTAAAIARSGRVRSAARR